MATPAQRKAAERARKRASGLAKYEFWLTRGQAKKVARFVLDLHKPKGERK